MAEERVVPTAIVEGRSGMGKSTLRGVPTAMVVGKSGMGKSTLCNYLLYGNPRPKNGFLAKNGKDPVTTACEAKAVVSTESPRRFTALKPGGPLKMIDTPGIPDPAGRTLEYYNDIVQTARQVGGLNALIITVCFNNDRDQIRKDFETYRILLTQFEKLPVLKILLCRVRLQPDLTEEQQQEDLVPVRMWINEILESGGMRSANVCLLIDDDTQIKQVFRLRKLMTQMPWTPIQNRNLRSYDELKEGAQRLITHDTRIEELQEKKVDLQLEKQQLKDRIVEIDNMNGWIIAAWASLFMIPWAVAKRNEKGANERRQSAIDGEVAEIDRELDGGHASREALQRDRDTLDQLELVAGATTTSTTSS